MSPNDRRSKWHLFGGSRDKESQDQVHHSAPDPRDSAYASSEHINSGIGGVPSSTDSGPSFSGSDNVATRGKASSQQNNDFNRDDSDDGVITTTTTTTTTTTRRVGKNGKTYTQTTPGTALGDEAQRQNPDRVENVTTNTSKSHSAGLPMAYQNSPAPSQGEYQAAQGGYYNNQRPKSYEDPDQRISGRAPELPNVTPKSAMRSSSPHAAADSSPNVAGRGSFSNFSNFSRPHGGREPAQMSNVTPISSQAGYGSTAQNLKAAAAGIHGVGETLRGTLNYGMDRHFGGASPETLAAHERVIQSGRHEIETGEFDHTAREKQRLQRKPPANSHGIMNKLRVANP